jgi:hypothetical protein
LAVGQFRHARELANNLLGGKTRRKQFVRKQWRLPVNSNKRANLLLAIGIIYVGILFIKFESVYSFKYQTRIYFIESPFKEIFGSLCIFWGIYYVYVIVKENGFEIIKINSPLLFATLLTLATITYLFARGLEGLIVLGLPVLIIEFAFMYIVSLHFQKRLRWDSLESKRPELGDQPLTQDNLREQDSNKNV